MALVLRILKIDLPSFVEPTQCVLEPANLENVQCLPTLKYDQLYQCFAVPSCAKNGRSMVERAKSYLLSTPKLPPALRNVRIGKIEPHFVVSSQVVASMKTKQYNARLFLYKQTRNARFPWVIYGQCTCPNGKSGRCAHVVATLLFLAHGQDPEEHRIPWCKEAPAFSIFNDCHWVKKRKHHNRKRSEPLLVPTIPKKRAKRCCSVCKQEGHTKTSSICSQ